jgi:hypothetical protein
MNTRINKPDAFISNNKGKSESVSVVADALFYFEEQYSVL